MSMMSGVRHMGGTVGVRVRGRLAIGVRERHVGVGVRGYLGTHGGGERLGIWVGEGLVSAGVRRHLGTRGFGERLVIGVRGRHIGMIGGGGGGHATIMGGGGGGLLGVGVGGRRHLVTRVHVHVTG